MLSILAKSINDHSIPCVKLNSLPAFNTDFSLYLISIIQKCNSSVDDAFYGIKWAHDLAECSINPCHSTLTKSVREAAHRIFPVTPEMLNNLVSMYSSDANNMFRLRSTCTCICLNIQAS
jgi:hypothetical protein